jgi:hypothetical protein
MNYSLFLEIIFVWGIINYPHLNIIGRGPKI